MNMKFGIGVVVAIVLQVSAFVWWTAQQAQTIAQLNDQVKELTSRMALEEQITLKNDLAAIRQATEEQYDWLVEIDRDIEKLVYFAHFTENRWAEAYANDNSYERQFGMKQPQGKSQ
jgi:hypothetical protein